MTTILVLHGPNLNLLGEREPEIYGHDSLDDINQRLKDLGKEMGVEVRAYQSNSEGVMIDALHEARAWANGVIINPGGYSHTSVAIRDAIAGIELPVIEVHLSNVHAREEFRRRLMLTPVCVASIAGFGWRSYSLALLGLTDLLAAQEI